MDSTQQAAILLLGMGEAKAANVLKYMDPKQVEKIVAATSEIGNITHDEIENVINEFNSASANETSIGVDSAQYIRSALIDALGSEKAEGIIDRALEDNAENGVATLGWQDEHAIISLIRDEHPQIIAVILTYLDSEKAALVLNGLPQVVRKDIMRRIAGIGSISPIALNELNQFIEESSKDVKSFKTSQTGGAKLAANIINYLGTEIESELIKDIEEFDQELSEKIKEYIFPFEDLAAIDKRSLQTLLRGVSTDTLMLALKGVEDKTRDSFLSNMSERAAEMLKDDLEASGPTQLSKVITAQKEIVGTAQRMAKDGEIVLGGKGEEMV